MRRRESPCGVVEVYSGAALIQSLPFIQPYRTTYVKDTIDAPYQNENATGYNNDSQKPGKNFFEEAIESVQPKQAYEETDEYKDWFYTMFAIRSERARQQMYDLVGLRKLRDSLININKTIGSPLSNLPQFDGCSLSRVFKTPVERVDYIFSKTDPDGGLHYKLKWVKDNISLKDAAHYLGLKYCNLPLTQAEIHDVEHGKLPALKISLKTMLLGAD